MSSDTVAPLGTPPPPPPPLQQQQLQNMNANANVGSVPPVEQQQIHVDVNVQHILPPSPLPLQLNPNANLNANDNANANANANPNPNLFRVNANAGAVPQPIIYHDQPINLLSKYIRKTRQEMAAYLTVVQTLLDNNAEANLSSRDNESPVTLLLQNQADVNQAEQHGHTPLWISASYVHLEVVRVLLSHPAIDIAIDYKDVSGVTALWAACQNKNSEVVELLLHHTVDTTGTAYACTPYELWAACQNNNSEVVELLLHSGHQRVMNLTNNGRLFDANAVMEGMEYNSEDSVSDLENENENDIWHCLCGTPYGMA